MLKLHHVLLVALFILHLQGDYVTLADNGDGGVVKEPVEEPAQPQADEQNNRGNEADDPPLIDEENDVDNSNDEAHELDHSKLSDSLNDEINNNEKMENDEQIEKEAEQRPKDTDGEEGQDLEHSKISDSLNDDVNNNENTGSDKQIAEQRQKESEEEEGTIEVIFDNGGVKVSRKINIMPGLQLMLREELEEDDDEELEAIDAEIEEEEEDIVTLEEGDELYEEAMKILSRKIGSHDSDRPYQLLSEAVAMGNTKAKEQIGYFYLFGTHVTQNFTMAREIFSELAADGNPAGQMGMGFLYSAGLGVNASQTKAIVYYTFAALQGHPLAQMAMGYRSHMGIGMPLSCEDALTYYSKVAKKVADGITITGGAAISRVRLLDEEEQISDVGNMDEDLIQYYQFLAEKGDLQAQMLLGQLYMQGLRGVPRDFKKALYYFSLADEEKNAAAQGFMGKIYAEGSEDVPASSSTALEYFKGAAKKGNPIGLSGLGMMYLNGMGTEQDYTKAFKYSAQSAEMGWLDGQLQLGIMYYHGYGMQRNYHQALKYFSLASQSGSTLAIYYLAAMHAYGIGVSRSCHTAVEFMKTVAEKGETNQLFVTAYDLYKMGEVDASLVQYLLLAELGYEVAQSNSAYIAENELSELVNNDLLSKRSLMLWSRAAGQGYGIARLKMGDYYYYGKGTGVNYRTAASHYRIASEQQSIARAMFNLGYMYEEGIGLEQDFHLAKRYYDLAVETDQSAQVPVSMALMKLHFTYYYELFSKQLRDFQLSSLTLYLQVWFGHNWDMYLITFLVLLSTLIYLTRQHRRQAQRRIQREGQR